MKGFSCNAWQKWIVARHASGAIFSGLVSISWQRNYYMISFRWHCTFLLETGIIFAHHRYSLPGPPLSDRLS